MKKFLLICMICLLLVGCTHIEDTNGLDDYSIVSISDDRIFKGGNYICSNNYESINKNKDNIKAEVRCSKFSGVKEIIGKVYNKNVTVTISSTASSGNFMVVVICNGELIKVKANTTKTLNLNSSGKLSVRIVGESANFKMKFSIEV